MNHLNSADINKFKSDLLEKQRKLNNSQTHMEQSDPFHDSGRLSDNAAIDDEAQEQEGHARLEALETEVSTTLRIISEALVRIETGTFGLCIKCQSEIPVERLRIDPSIQYCMKCQKPVSQI